MTQIGDNTLSKKEESSVCRSGAKGQRKLLPGVFNKEHSVEHNAHVGKWHRQVSLLALESINEMRDRGLNVNPVILPKILQLKVCC